MMLELGALAGAFLQVIVPFPSWFILLPAGATIGAQHGGLWRIAILALLVGLVRVLGGFIVYAVSEKLYGYLYTKRTTWWGIRKTQIDMLRQKLGSRGSWWTIFIMWALPIVPSTLIPLSAGFVRVPLRIFITATYAGAVINALLYLVIGYYGLQGATWLWLLGA